MLTTDGALYDNDCALVINTLCSGSETNDLHLLIV